MSLQVNEYRSTMDANTLFYIDDFNFTNYDRTLLKLVCEHNLLTMSRFPKLVLHLFCSEMYSKMYNAAIDKNEDTKMTFVLESVNEFTHPLPNTQLSPIIVTSEDPKLLHCIQKRLSQISNAAQESPVSHATKTVDMLREKKKHEEIVNKNVSNEMNRDRNNVYYNYTDGFLKIQQARRTRKNLTTHTLVKPENKYDRFITIT